MCLQSGDNGFLDDGLAIRYAVQLGIQCMTLYREGVLLADEFFPRQFFDALEQIFKLISRKLSHLNQNTFRGGKAEVCFCQDGQVAFK